MWPTLVLHLGDVLGSASCPVALLGARQPTGAQRVALFLGHGVGAFHPLHQGEESRFDSRELVVDGGQGVAQPEKLAL